MFSPLSNFYPAPFVANDIKYVCLEQYYQHCKAVICCDASAAAKILIEDDPPRIKRLGGSVAVTSNDAWETSAEDVMKAGLLAKFTQNPALGHSLIDTGTGLLAESAKFDTYWGTGLSIDDDKALDPTEWPGKNRLGHLLVEAREFIRGASASAIIPM